MNPPLALQVSPPPPPSTQGLERPLAPLGRTEGKRADRIKAAIRRQSFSTRPLRVGLLSFLAVVALTINYFRICYGMRKGGNAGRRLAERESRSGEDPILSTILEMCLDMEEESHGCPQTTTTTQGGHWEPHPLQPPHQQGQQEIPAVPSTSGWEAFQQYSNEEFLHPQRPPDMWGSYHQGWSHNVETPLEGPSTSWQGSSMLPPFSTSVSTMASDGSTTAGPPWPMSSTLPSQGMGQGSSFGGAGAHVPGVPPAMEWLNPVYSLGSPLSDQVNTQPSTSHMGLAHMQAAARLHGLSEGTGHTLSPSLAASGGNTAVLADPHFGGSGFSTYAEHVGASVPNIWNSGPRVQELDDSGMAQGFSFSGSLQAAGNTGTWPNMQVSSEHPVVSPGGGLANHPFYKLATLQRGVSLDIAQFAPEEVFTPTPGVYLPTSALRRLHKFLTKNTISKFEADEIIRCSQRVASHLYNCHQSSLTYVTPADAVMTLGRRYIVMDLLVCAIQVLGPAMEASVWWEKFAKSIPSDVSLSCVDFPSRRCMSYIALANRLSLALRLLKQGIRPSPADTISLKRELFCRPESHPEFKHRRWDPWRWDDSRAGMGQLG
ncbi:hypothetical protein, conserved [Eimeria brunetti]|uniref:Uncharacterized protein n=1 Tax=Eimeria brunetti TaxID=51314 RepID=U6LH83_9EIME|nr:hypothetical protein, conserved [Eimeria brunetti]